MNLLQMNTSKSSLDLIEKLAPEHDRTSCSDDNLSNCAVFEDGKMVIGGRCRRCSLIALADSDYKPDPENSIYYEL